MTLEQLQQQEQELEQLLSENRAKQREIHTKAFVEKYGADVGDTVEWTDRGEIKKGLITYIEYSGCRPYALFAKHINKDGKPGNRELRIWPNELQTIKLIKKNIKQS